MYYKNWEEPPRTCAYCGEKEKWLDDYIFIDGAREHDVLLDERYWGMWICPSCYDFLIDLVKARLTPEQIAKILSGE
jgi:hypothetical protein